MRQMLQMTENAKVCPNCDRADCEHHLTPNFKYPSPEFPFSPGGYAKFQAACVAWERRQAECAAHAVNWRERAKAAEAVIAGVRTHAKARIAFNTRMGFGDRDWGEVLELLERP